MREKRTMIVVSLCFHSKLKRMGCHLKTASKAFFFLNVFVFSFRRVSHLRDARERRGQITASELNSCV